MCHRKHRRVLFARISKAIKTILTIPRLFLKRRERLRNGHVPNKTVQSNAQMEIHVWDYKIFCERLSQWLEWVVVQLDSCKAFQNNEAIHHFCSILVTMNHWRSDDNLDEVLVVVNAHTKKAFRLAQKYRLMVEKKAYMPKFVECNELSSDLIWTI